MRGARRRPLGRRLVRRIGEQLALSRWWRAPCLHGCLLRPFGLWVSPGLPASWSVWPCCSSSTRHAACCGAWHASVGQEVDKKAVDGVGASSCIWWPALDALVAPPAHHVRGRASHLLLGEREVAAAPYPMVGAATCGSSNSGSIKAAGGTPSLAHSWRLVRRRFAGSILWPKTATTWTFLERTTGFEPATLTLAISLGASFLPALIRIHAA